MTTVITGANRGIGAALRDRLSAAGHQVLGTTRGTPAADFVQLDVSKPDQFSHLSDALADAPVELLVCNAGVYLDKGADVTRDYGPAQWAETFATNVTGVFLTIQTLLPNLRAAKGKIAIISSQMASSTHAPGGSYIYRSSKAAVLNLGRNLSQDLRADGIAVGIYHPGWVVTDMGGAQADITVDDAADGLCARFEALSIATTGCFETWDGRPHAF